VSDPAGGSVDGVEVVGGGEIDAEEVAAIVAAVEALWPRPVIDTTPPRPPAQAWKMSGRWWSRPLPVRRDRPWR
jgi:hypothetical protein